MQEVLKIVERSLGCFDNICCSTAICRLGTLIGVNAANSHILGDKRYLNLIDDAREQLSTADAPGLLVLFKTHCVQFAYKAYVSGAGAHIFNPFRLQ